MSASVAESQPSGALFRPCTAGWYAFIAILSALVAWAALFFLPVDPYLRYRALSDTDWLKGRWIYERLHFDPTPIDIAFLGTSRMMQGIDSMTVQDEVDSGGTSRQQVVNLSLPGGSYDIRYLVAKMLFETKKPKVLVVEAHYGGSPRVTPIFARMANFEEALDTPLLVNRNLLGLFLQLPGQNAKLALHTVEDGTPAFDPSQYIGPHWDDTYRTTNHDGLVSEPRTTFLSPAAFERARETWIRNMVRADHRFYHALAVRYDTIFFRRLVSLARAKCVPIVFLYYDVAGAPPVPLDSDYLHRNGIVLDLPSRFAHDNTLWFNPTHLNAYGAEVLSRWIGEKLRTMPIEPQNACDAPTTQARSKP